jgi:hypothetical protein
MKNKGVLALAIMVVLCFGLLWVLHSSAQTTTTNLGQTRQALVSALSISTNQIDLSSAKRFVGNFKSRGTNQVTNRGGVFTRKAIDKLLAQPKVVGIRYIYSMKDDGTSSLVLVGVDATGSDMTTADDQIIDNPIPCPPLCDSDSPVE